MTFEKVSIHEKDMKYLILCFVALAFVACSEEDSHNNNKNSEYSDVLPRLDAILEKIESIRDDIKGSLSSLERIEIHLDSARSQVRQKWSKMHAYVKNGEIVRIKMYPHESISLRTEEFYYENEKIRFVFIEDKGMKHKSSDAEKFGRSFWFEKDRLVKADDHSKDGRELRKVSYEERLLDEAYEYLDIAKSNTQ